jgi:site-specific recombinase XerD
MFISLSQSELDTFLSRYENKHTKDQYKNSVSKFHSFLIQAQIYNLDAVTLEVAHQFKADLEANYSPKTCELTINACKEFYKFLNARSLTNNTQFSLLKSTQVSSRSQKTPYVSESEIKRMIKTTYSNDDRTSLTNRLMLIILFNGGLRESELANLKLSDLRLQGEMYVASIMGKGMRQRFLTFSKPVTNELQKLIKLLKIKSSEYLIQPNDRGCKLHSGKPISRVSIFNRIKKIASDAKIDKVISPHSLRRGCATQLYKLNTPIEVIQRILGHNSTVITSKYIAKEIDISVSATYALEIA